MTSAITSRYSLGPVKPWVEAAAYYLGPKYNIKSIGGWRKSDPFPDHPSGHALDFMTDIPNGNALANDAIAHYKELGIKYIIHNRQVWNPQQGWHPYTSTSNPHTDHVHITFNDSAGTAFVNGSLSSLGVGGTFTGTDGSVTPTGFTNVADANCAWSLSFPVAGQTCIISKSALRGVLGGVFIVGAVVAGVVGVVILVAFALKDTKAGQAVVSSTTTAASVVPGGGVVAGAVRRATK